jgi:hypothetical protein
MSPASTPRSKFLVLFERKVDDLLSMGCSVVLKSDYWLEVRREVLHKHWSAWFRLKRTGDSCEESTRLGMDLQPKSILSSPRRGPWGLLVCNNDTREKRDGSAIDCAFKLPPNYSCNGKDEHHSYRFGR